MIEADDPGEAAVIEPVAKTELTERLANLLGSSIFAVLLLAFIAVAYVADSVADEEMTLAEWIIAGGSFAALVVLGASSVGLVFYRPWAPPVVFCSSGIALFIEVIDVISRLVKAPLTQNDLDVLDAVYSAFVVSVFVAAVFFLRGRRIAVEKRVSRRLHWTLLFSVGVSALVKSLNGSEMGFVVAMLLVPVFICFWLLEGAWRFFFRSKQFPATAAT